MNKKKRVVEIHMDGGLPTIQSKPDDVDVKILDFDLDGLTVEEEVERICECNKLPKHIHLYV